MFRDELCDGCGMLFIFEEQSIHTFWMKNTLIPLDMIFIDSDMEVVDLINAQPCKHDPCVHYTPEHESLYVLEVNPGIFDQGVVGKKVNMVNDY